MSIALTPLSPAEKAFIRNHLTSDVRALLLRPHPANVDLKKMAAQIEARQKTRDKLPAWYAHDDVLYPPALAVEQASSEQTAAYKASLVGGALLMDLTGGMGVDARAFAQGVGLVTYVEQQPALAELAAHNLPLLGAANVRVQAGNGLAVVCRLNEPADWIYLDPHRRNGQGGKQVLLANCEPDLSQAGVLADLLAKTKRLLLKTSPLIDIDATIRQLGGPADGLSGYVEAVHVVAVQGEVKEILFVLGHHRTPFGQVGINAVNLLTDKTISLQFGRDQERGAEVVFGDPQHYIYEPNAAVLKSGAFRLAAARFGLAKIAPSSHLYTGTNYTADFPGRIFELNHVTKPDRSVLQALVPQMKANLTVRNFPQSVAELRKKLNLQEGGDVYVFATTLRNGDRKLLITRKAVLPSPS